MIRKIDELITEHENRIEQQDAIIARSQFQPDEHIFSERKKAVGRLSYLMDLKESGHVYMDARELDSMGF